MNIYDISAKAGVSIATVSRIINGTANVRPATREKVMAVIDECGYTPNAFAQGLNKNTMHTIGIMCADSADPFMAEAVYYLEKKLRISGYDSILCCTGYNLDDRRKYLELLMSKHVDSVVMVGSNFVLPLSEQNRYIFDAAQKIPVMLLNGALTGDNIYSTVCDDDVAMEHAVSSLIESGTSTILYLYDSTSYSGCKKLSGYKNAMQRHGLPSDEGLLCYMKTDSDTNQPGTLREVQQALKKKRAQGILFNAVVASDDRLAIGALKFAHSEGLCVPDEFQIIGYNNSRITEFCEPELTSVDNKLEALCRHCADTVINVLSGEEMPQTAVLAGKLIKRGTTSF